MQEFFTIVLNVRDGLKDDHMNIVKITLVICVAEGGP